MAKNLDIGAHFSPIFCASEDEKNFGKKKKISKTVKDKALKS